MHYLTYAKKQKKSVFHYKSLKLWKIDYIDLTLQFSYQFSPISVINRDTDFYRLSTPGIKVQ